MTWTVRLHTIPDDKIEALLAYCRLADEQDPTFSFAQELEDGKVKCVTIACLSKDNAFKRGCLFHHRFGCYYEVEWRRA